MVAGHKTKAESVGSLALRLASAGKTGVTFSVLYCGCEIGEARFVPVWGGLPRLASYEHSGAYPHERIDHGQLEPLAAQEITKLLQGRPEDMAMAWRGGFFDMPKSGAGRRGRSRKSVVMAAVEARRALNERHRTASVQKVIERARGAGLLVGDDPTESMRELLAEVDETKRQILALLDTKSLWETPDLLEVLDFDVEYIDAALRELANDGKVALTGSNDELRKRTGFECARVERKRGR